MHTPPSVMAYINHQAAMRRRLGRFIRAIRPHNLTGADRRSFNAKLRQYATSMLE